VECDLHELGGCPAPSERHLFGEDLTRRLIARARAEHTTVHSALVAAMSRAIIESGRNEFVRMLTPFDFRSHIGVDDAVCLYFTGARTGFTGEQLTGLWDMARTVSDQLAVARSLPAVLAVSAATEQLIPIDATTQDAEDFMVGGAQLRGLRSNLRVLDVGPPEAVRPVAIWGPAIALQFRGELNAGICTFNASSASLRPAMTHSRTTSSASATPSTPLAEGSGPPRTRLTANHGSSGALMFFDRRHHASGGSAARIGDI
jgi:hypothetical protein